MLRLSGMPGGGNALVSDYKLVPGMRLLVHSSKSCYEVYVGQALGSIGDEGVSWYYYAFAYASRDGARSSWGAPTARQINAAQARGLS